MAEIKLTSTQQAAIEEIEHNLQIIACAGSGKTEVIARRIAYILEKNPQLPLNAIVAFTFTNKAADALRERISRMLPTARSKELADMYIGTIHGYCLHLLKTYASDFSAVKVLDSVKQHHFIWRYHKHCGMETLGLSRSSIHVNIFVQCAEKMLDDYDHRDTWPQEQQDALEEYMGCLRQHGFVDYSLLIFGALRQIREDSACTQALSKVRYLVVDEYQDVDDLQEQLIGCFADNGTNLCVVGDDDQAIYQFRGGSADHMITFADRYPDVRSIRLETNFRCARGIVDLADTVIRNNCHRLRKEMKVVDSAPAKGLIQATRFGSAQEQFAGIAAEIKKIHNLGVPWGQIAILARKGKTVARIVWALEEAGVPVFGDSAERFFEEEHFQRLQDTVKSLVSLDRMRLYSCWDDIAEQGAFATAFKGLRSAARGGEHRLSTMIRNFCETLAFIDEAAEDYPVRKACLDGICRMLDDFDDVYGDWQLSARIDEFLRFMKSRAAAEYKYHPFSQGEHLKEAVQVMTVHKAKGLEYRCVFLANLMEKEFPVGPHGGKQYWHVLGGHFEENKDRYLGGIEDERKLFYVAVTRAKEMLYLTYELSSQPVSRFVREATKSSYLLVDTDDLTFDSEKGEPQMDDILKSDTEEYEELDWEAERQARQAYWALVKEARHRLYDFYGTAAHFNPGAMGDLTRVNTMSPEQILQNAQENGLI